MVRFPRIWMSPGECRLKRELAARRRSEVALRESGAVLAKAQRIAKTGNWRWSIERKELVSCSEEFARIHGVGMDEVHDLMKQDMEPHIRPANAP